MTDCRPPRTPPPPNYQPSSSDSPQDFNQHYITPTPPPEKSPACGASSQTFWIGVNGQIFKCSLCERKAHQSSPAFRVNKSKARSVCLLCTPERVIGLSGLTVAVRRPDTEPIWNESVKSLVPPKERPLARLMGACVEGENLFVCAGYYIFRYNLSDGFCLEKKSLQGYLPQGTGPSFSTLLLCDRAMIVGLPRACLCISRTFDIGFRWECSISNRRPSPICCPEPGDIPTFAALSDEQIIACCNGCVFLISTKIGVYDKSIRLVPSWSDPILTFHDKDFDKNLAFVLVKDSLWAITVYEAFEVKRPLRVFSSDSGSNQISMAWDSTSKLIFVAGHGEVVCVQHVPFEIKWRKRYQPDDKSAMVLRFDKNLKLLVLCVGNTVILFEPDVGTPILRIRLPKPEVHSYGAALCTPGSNYDLNASGILHNNYLAALARIRS